ncbi:MAG: DinB family protein [Rhodanobacteraceae bacterium]
MAATPAPRQPLGTLMRYAAWANDRIYAALAAVPADELMAPTPIFAGSILRTLHHVYLIDVVWKSHLLGVAHAYTARNPETSPPFTELREAQRDIDGWFIEYATTLTPGAGDEIVDFTFIGGSAGAMPRSDILMHVATHTSYHRGHLTAMLYGMKIAPPVTDLPVYLRDENRGQSAISSKI